MNTPPSMPRPLDVVALLADRPQDGLVRGQVGTVVEDWGDGTYEVEFVSDLDGATFTTATLAADQVVRLWYRPAQAA